MKKIERTYRASFGSTSGKVLYLDFYAENLEFARAHAHQCASDSYYAPTKRFGDLHLVNVRTAPEDEFSEPNAGAWLVKCASCSSLGPLGQSCGCFDNGGQ